MMLSKSEQDSISSYWQERRHIEERYKVIPDYIKKLERNNPIVAHCVNYYLSDSKQFLDDLIRNIITRQNEWNEQLVKVSMYQYNQTVFIPNDPTEFTCPYCKK